MGLIKEFEPEKLVVGILFRNLCFYEKAICDLVNKYGPIDSESEMYNFSAYSNYYDNELGGTVQRKFVSFARLVNPSSLSLIKQYSNALEEFLSENHKRCVNIDPCILSHGRFVMATTKGASFRIPLSNGVYGDLSLIYSKGSWIDFFWTYSDIKSDHFKSYITNVRSIFLFQRRNLL